MDSRFLTKSALEEKRNATVPGMAFWAGTDPGRRTCGVCKYYGYDHAKGRKHALCGMFYKLTHKHGETPIPKDTAACHYFEKREERR